MKRSLAALCCLLLASCAAADEDIPRRAYGLDILRDVFGYNDQTPRLIELDELFQGCPMRDCIRSIDAPKYLPADKAEFLRDDDFVLVLEHAGQKRAYPTRIMLRHEIVNDIVAGDPLAITFCPLCGTGTAFHRVVDGEPVRFGVSGLLYKSDLVMFDAATYSLWSQVEGQAIVGPKTGTPLRSLPVNIVRWGPWRSAHPDTRVLSTDTGLDRDYEVNPYEDYEASERLMFLPAAATDKRLHPKALVYGVEADGAAVAVTHERLAAAGSVSAPGGAQTVTFTMSADGVVTATAADGAPLIPLRAFWFAWYVFHPDTALLP